jgi:hypothetical protein
MKLVVVLVLSLVVYTLATPFTKILNEKVLCQYIQDTFSDFDAVNVKVKDNKFPFEAVLAGAKLGKLLYKRIKNKDFRTLSLEEFSFATEKKAVFPLGALLAGTKIGKFIQKRIDDKPDLTLDAILTNSTFPWKKVIKAAKIGNKVVDYVRIGATLPKGTLKKIMKGKKVDLSINIKRIVSEIKKTSVFKNAVKQVADQILKKQQMGEFLADDRDQCNKCIQYCNLLPAGKQACISNCEMSSACRTKDVPIQPHSDDKVLVMDTKNVIESDADSESETNDDAKCALCKQGCATLPPTVQQSCITQCEMNICRNTRKVETKSDVDTHCSLCLSACQYVNSNKEFCTTSCSKTCSIEK